MNPTRWSHKRGRFSFYPGERVRGNDKKGSFPRERLGTVIKYGPGKGEYLVKFDDGREEYVNTEWLEAQDSQ